MIESIVNFQSLLKIKVIQHFQKYLAIILNKIFITILELMQSLYFGQNHIELVIILTIFLIFIH